MWQAFGGAAIGALAGYLGQESANDTNVMLSRETSAFNAQQAQLNRDFQERMSNTSYQRAINDMEQAGLNPMLAYSQGGASAPSGSSASGVTAHVENEMLPLASAFQYASTLAQVEKLEAETEETRARTVSELERPENLRQERSESVQRVVNLQAQENRLAEQNALSRAQVEKLKHEVFVLKEEQGIRAAELMLKRLEMMLKEMEFPQAIAEAKAWATDYGQNVRPYLRDVQGAAGSASSVLRSVNPLRRGMPPSGPVRGQVRR